jgi:hypothetical protein
MKKFYRLKFPKDPKNGPFSSINEFTTRIGNFEAARMLGLDYDALSEDEEFAEGVVNYHKIAEDPIWGKK